MSLTAGTRLGPYEVIGALGAGGMGEVYKAKDTRLDRVVALKVLSAETADDPEFRARFEREAKTISQLNHPHICVLHDVGHQNGRDFLVMEYLEGQTLAARLDKGPLPLDQALQYATEIADALDRAHRQGVVHRDLTCLAKDPEERWQNAHDLASELRWIAESGSPVASAAAGRAAPRQIIWRAAVIAASVVVGATLASLWWRSRGPSSSAPVQVRAVAALAPGVELTVGSRPPLALSPDGKVLAYAATAADGSIQILIRPLDRFEGAPLGGTQGGTGPFFRPMACGLASSWRRRAG